MTDMGKMTFRPSDFLVDKVFGKVGTPERERMEAELKKEVDHYFMCEALKESSVENCVSAAHTTQPIVHV